MEQLKNKPVYEKLYELQETYNQHTNITRINNKEDYYSKHILDSLALVKLLPPNIKLIDIGSGGGYPGLPIAIERPDILVTLNDTIQKKTTYLSSVCQELHLTNATIVKARAEELGQNPEYREQFDAATARAVADISVLLELTAPLVKVGGIICLMKSKTYQEELALSQNAQALVGVNLSSIEPYIIEGIERVVLIFKKEASSPIKYPRKPGIPEKKPLK